MDLRTGKGVSKRARKKKGGQYQYQLQSKAHRKPPPNLG